MSLPKKVYATASAAASEAVRVECDSRDADTAARVALGIADLYIAAQLEEIVLHEQTNDQFDEGYKACLTDICERLGIDL